ncbi:hypothetical protein [Nesterenkonia pannonica]|uniref:hypothetical protein n=1 Tax=Nesterenkonia pannonica TaxID=1548602 RepID=UPI002164044A|nr:hypothetical protein [Nesterenkonia pannonica]
MDVPDHPADRCGCAAAGPPRLNADPGTRDKRLSVPSLLLSAPGFGGIVYGISQIGGGHGTEELDPEDAGASVDPVAVGVLLVGVVFLAAFVLLQLRLQKTESALLNLKPFTYTQYTRALLMMLLMMIALFGALILLPLFLQQVYGLTPCAQG